MQNIFFIKKRIFWRKCHIWPPGVLMYGLTPWGNGIYFEKLLICFNFNMTFAKIIQDFSPLYALPPLYTNPLYTWKNYPSPFKEISRACKQGMLHWFYLNITVTKMLLNFFKCWSKSFFFKSSSDLWMSPKKTKSSQTLKKTEKRKYQFLSISNLKKSNAKPKRDFGVNFMKFHKNVVRYMHVFCVRTLGCANFCPNLTDRFQIIKKTITLTDSTYP